MTEKTQGSHRTQNCTLARQIFLSHLWGWYWLSRWWKITTINLLWVFFYWDGRIVLFSESRCIVTPSLCGYLSLYRVQTGRGSHRGDWGQRGNHGPQRNPEGRLHRARLHRPAGSSADGRDSGQLLPEVTSEAPLPPHNVITSSLSNKTACLISTAINIHRLTPSNHCKTIYCLFIEHV